MTRHPQISGYNGAPSERYGIRNTHLMVGKRLTWRGFHVFDPDMGPEHTAEHQRKMQAWLADGSVKAKLHVTEGLDNAAEGFVGMLQGKNFGKAVLKIRDE
jgi:NADPH-dependent curcumin reductase CurA